VRLMEMYNWTSIFIIIDESSVSFYSFIGRVIQEPFQKRKILVTKLAYCSAVRALDYDQALEEVFQKSRGEEKYVVLLSRKKFESSDHARFISSPALLGIAFGTSFTAGFNEKYDIFRSAFFCNNLFLDRSFYKE
jgi:hypothetical protein